MSASVPWSVKGIDRKSRETAKDLARRSGMTLGEWLNQVIEYQGEGKVTPLPQNATLNEAIDRLNARVEAVETRSSLAVTGMDQSVRGLAARIDTHGGGDVSDALKSLEASLAQIAAQVYANEAAQKASLAEVRDEIARMARTVNVASSEGVDNRLAEMEGHIARAEQRSSKAIEGIGQQVLLMADTVQRQVEGIDQRTTTAIDRVERDVARVADQIEGKLSQADQAQAAALEKLGAEIERITARLSERIGQGEARAFAASEGEDAQPSPFAGRIRQSEERTSALLDEARETIEGRLEALQSQAAPEATDFSPRSFFREEPAEAQPGPAAHVAAEAADDADPIEAELAQAFAITRENAAEDDFVQPAGKALDPFAIEEGDDPFAEGDDEFEPAAVAEASPQAPVVYPSEDPARADYAFAPQDFEIVGDDAAQAATEELAPVSLDEARSFETVEFDAADPFSADDEFETEAEFEAAAEAEAELEAEPAAEAEAGEETVFDPFAVSEAPATESFSHDQTIDDEAVSFQPQAFEKTDEDPFGAEEADGETTEAEAFEPGPFGRADHHFEDAATEATVQDEPAELAAAETDDQTEAQAEDHVEAESQEPAQPISYLERARLAAQKANSDEAKRGKGGFSLSAFGFGNRRRGGAKLKSGLLMSTAVLVCLASGLAGAAMLAPLLKETGAKLSDKSPTASPQAAMMTNPQPIKPEATAAAPLAPAADAKPVDPSASMIYAESLSLLSAKDKKGVELLQKAANLGYPQAELQLGHLYETGYPGLQSDLVLARKWTEKAAEAGLPSAMHNLAMLIYNGEGGTKSPTLAAQWFRQAAELGQVDSQFNLGLLYENGKGVQANPAEAYKWFVLASRGGDAGSRAEARAAAQRVRPLISAEAQAAAERAAMAYGASQQAAAQ